GDGQSQARDRFPPGVRGGARRLARRAEQAGTGRRVQGGGRFQELTLRNAVDRRAGALRSAAYLFDLSHFLSPWQNVRAPPPCETAMPTVLSRPPRFRTLRDLLNRLGD